MRGLRVWLFTFLFARRIGTFFCSVLAVVHAHVFSNIMKLTFLAAAN